MAPILALGLGLAIVTAGGPIVWVSAGATLALFAAVAGYSLLFALPFALLFSLIPQPKQPALQAIPVRARKAYACPDWSRYNHPFLGK